MPKNKTTIERKYIIAAIVVLIIVLGCFFRVYIIAAYQTLTFKVVKPGDKFYATDEFAQSSIPKSLFWLVIKKTPAEIDKMDLSAEKKIALKKRLTGLANFKIIDSGAAFVGDSLRKYKTLFLGECLDTTSAQYKDVVDISKMSINKKVINLKYNNADAIPEGYKILDDSFYMRSYGYGLDVK